MMAVPFQILIFVSTVCSFIASTRIAISSVNSFNKEAIDTLSSQLNEESIALVTFGFDSETSKLLRNSLYDAMRDESLDDDTTSTSCMVINGANPQYLRQISTPNVVVGFLPKTLLVSDPTTLLNHIQAYIDGVFYRKTSPKTTSNLILIVEEDTDIEPFKKVVDWMLEHAAHPDKGKIEVTFLSTKDGLVEEVKAKVFQVMGATAGCVTKELMLSLSLSDQELKSSSTSAEEVEAAVDCRVLCDDFVKTFTSKIEAVISTPSMTINNTLATLQMAIDESVEDNYEEHTAMFDRHAGTQALASAAYRARSEVTDLLAGVYDRIVDSTVLSNTYLFDKRVLRVPPTSKLVKNLKLLGEAVVFNCKEALEDASLSFRALCCTTSEKGLFSATDTRSFRSSLKKKLIRKSQLLRFEANVAARAKERVESLFLGGQYNPYVRDAPFPPTHINLNYLIDPRAVAIGMQYNSLYDEHVDAVVKDRADPLIFPGVTTTLPFDPNDHPSAKDVEVPWYELVKDFFTQEE